MADLKIGTVILPRSETPEIVSRLTEFEWFHKIDSTSETVTPEVDDILLKAQQTFQEIDEVIKGLEIPREVGMLEILFKGTVFKKQNQELDELEKMVDEIAKKAPGIIDAPAKLLKEQEEYKKEISDYTTLKETLEVVKKLNVDLTGFGLMKQFYTNLFIVQTKDIDEIKRTLDNVTINQYPLNTKEESALMIIADVANLEKILKVMRSFNANPFSIPENVEQVPTKAYATAELKIKEFEEKHKKVTKEIAKMIAKIRQDILTLHERASVAKDVLELLRKPGGTKNFAVVQGYIPKKMEKKFKDTTGKWMSIVEDVSDPELSKKRPTLFDNKIFVCGIDEAGRGCLAGPVTAAAVVLPKKYKNPYIKDSKKLNKSDRLDLYNEIIECSLDYAIIDISPKIIDSINILESTFLAMNNAISKIHNKIDYTIIDGNKFKTEKKIKYKCIVKGDNIYQSIAAASILAKVHRDKIMEDLHLNFPKYDWINNKGYGTSKHRLAIRNYGITKHHRKSFNLVEKQLKIKI